MLRGTMKNNESCLYYFYYPNEIIFDGSWLARKEKESINMRKANLNRQ